jgi:hypothetical protein
MLGNPVPLVTQALCLPRQIQAFGQSLARCLTQDDWNEVKNG